MIDRPEIVVGKTYKLNPPIIDEAIYVTINDAEIGGTVRPIEIFINSKDMKSFQWISLITRLLSAHMREDKEFPVFLLEEMDETYSPGGGYFIPRTQYWAHSIVAHIGWILRRHCIELGVVQKETTE